MSYSLQVVRVHAAIKRKNFTMLYVFRLLLTTAVCFGIVVFGGAVGGGIGLLSGMVIATILFLQSK